MIFALGKWYELGMKLVHRTQIIIKEDMLLVLPIVDIQLLI